MAKEVGTDGILGGQASVDNVGGTWKDLTDNVNTMASNVCLLYLRQIPLVNPFCSLHNKSVLSPSPPEL